VRSVSITGLSIVTITFADRTNDFFARQQVTERLTNVTLPPNITPVLAPLSNAVGEIFRYAIEAPESMAEADARLIRTGRCGRPCA
jgi:cobalt-zinc-cadmium resistance protein CzcA